MPYSSNPEANPETKDVVILGTIAAAAAGFWWWLRRRKQEPEPTTFQDIQVDIS